MKKVPITDDMLTPAMLIGYISRVQRSTLRSRESDPIMTQNSCRAILFCLAREEGITQLELSHRAGLKPPTVSVALKHLEDEGYVVRNTDDDDKRAARVYLSDKGHALQKDNHDRFVAVDNEMMAGFTSGFILPFAVGACVGLQGEAAVLRDAFGVVALVAMTPLITIQLLGFRGIVAEKLGERKAMKRILDADDQQIINFM